MTKHEATAEQWGALYEDAFHCDATSSCLLELLSRVVALEAKYETQRLATLEWGADVDKVKRWSDRHLQRIEALEANVTCSHIATSDEGTSYCTLAEQTTKPPLISGSLVESVHRAISTNYGDGPVEARAAIRVIAGELRAQCFVHAADWLEQEAER